MKVRAEWQGGLKFFGYDERGHRSVFDSGPDSENTAGPAPMQMFLEALITCAGMDIVYILRKRRKKIERFFVEVEAERADKHPKIFENIQVKYCAAGEGINEYEMDSLEFISE